MSALLPEWETSCREAVTLLDESTSLPTPQMIDVTDAALRKIIKARDGMIDRLRAEPGAARAELWRAALNQVNVTLSEMASVQYPGALNREHIEQSKALLQQLLAGAEPLVKGEMEPLREPAGVSGTVAGGVADEDIHRVDATSEPPLEEHLSGIEGGVDSTQG